MVAVILFIRKVTMAEGREHSGPCLHGHDIQSYANATSLAHAAWTPSLSAERGPAEVLPRRAVASESGPGPGGGTPPSPDR